MDVPFFKLSPVDGELELVKQVLDSGWLTTGKFAKELEAKFQVYTGAKHALAVNSCTAALHLAVEAIGVGPGDSVVVPSLTFTASAEVIRYVGADPVFVDVDESTLLMTAAGLRKALSENRNIKAVIAAHFGGQSVEMTGPEGILTVCREYGVKLIQDAAHAFPSYDQYGPVGSLGDVTCFSFYANKTMTTGEGGMLVTSDDDIAGRVKVMRLHGIDRDVWDRFTAKNASGWMYDVKAPGFKYNMPDLNAAVGVAQFEKAFSFRDRRQEIAEQYVQGLSSLPELALIGSRVQPDHHAWHLFPLVVSEQSNLSRDDLIALLNEAGVGTSVHYRPLHQMTYYRDTYRLVATNFPIAEKYWNGCLSLPIYPSMDDDKVQYVINVVKNSIQYGGGAS